jgi:hypothetical protein
VVDCCKPIHIPGAGLRLEERSEERESGGDKFRLYECPSCGAFWIARDALWDHGTWCRKEYIRVTNANSFEAFLESARTVEQSIESVPQPSVAQSRSDITRAFQIATIVGGMKEYEPSE